MKYIYNIAILLLFLTACSNEPTKELSFEGKKEFDFNQTVKEADAKGKKVLIYFTALGCPSCRKMEENVLAQEKIKKLIQEDYIFIPLNVEDKTQAEKKYWRVGFLNKDTLKKIGQLGADLQIDLTRTGSQPQFAIVSKDKKVLDYRGYAKEEKVFLEFLKGQLISCFQE